MIETKYGAGTQRAIIVKMLVAGKTLDWLTAFYAGAGSKLSTRIGEIERSHRYRIERKMVERFGKRFMTYWLSKETIKQLRAIK